MKAVGLTRYLPITNEQSLQDIELPKPKASGRDLLVKINAVGVNPVDTKVRKPKDKIETSPKVLGWDACGIVEAVGDKVSQFNVGDKVYYAGDITRQGCNAEYQLIDERIVGLAPQTLTSAQAAAMPLTSVTAWEALFERMYISQNKSDNTNKSILILGGAGGVGSIAIQLAKQVAGLTVITTASRAVTIAWVKNLGADIVVNHHHLLAEMQAQHLMPDYILCNNDTDAYFAIMAEIVKPQGHICSIVETTASVDLGLLKNKCASFSWEFMFVRSMYQTDDMYKQGDILNRVSQLIDSGTLKHTAKTEIKPINATNLRAAHAQLESGNTIGKIVLSGW